MRLGPAEVIFTGRAEGDLGHGGRHVDVDALDASVVARRAAVLDRPWTWLRQVHGDRVVVVDGTGHQSGERADALVTAAHDAALAIFTADCAPVALASPEGIVGAVHAGWRGLLAGVIERTVATMRDLGATDVRAALGPCIHAECYEFGPADLDRVASSLGDAVRAETSAGAPALDLPAGVAAALTRAGAALVMTDDRCTSCAAAECYSFRARQETERQALVVWLP